MIKTTIKNSTIWSLYPILPLDTDHNGVPDLWNTLNSRQGYIKTDVTKEYTVITNEGKAYHTYWQNKTSPLSRKLPTL